MMIILGDVCYIGRDLNNMRYDFESCEDEVFFGVQKVKDKNLIKESYGIRGNHLIEKPEDVTRVKPLLGLGIYFARPYMFEVIDMMDKSDGEQQITEAISQTFFKYPYELNGYYANINYKEQYGRSRTV